MGYRWGLSTWVSTYRDIVYVLPSWLGCALFNFERNTVNVAPNYNLFHWQLRHLNSVVFTKLDSYDIHWLSAMHYRSVHHHHICYILGGTGKGPRRLRRSPILAKMDSQSDLSALRPDASDGFLVSYTSCAFWLVLQCSLHPDAMLHPPNVSTALDSWSCHLFLLILLASPYLFSASWCIPPLIHAPVITTSINSLLSQLLAHIWGTLLSTSHVSSFTSHISRLIRLLN